MFYKEDKELHSVIERVRKRIHKERLDRLTYVALIRDPVQVSAGRIIPGRVFAASALVQHFHGSPLDVVIEVGASIWNADEMGKDDREAFADDLLTSIARQKDEGFKVLGPDFSGHRQVVDRWGAWNANMVALLKNYEKRQEDLPLEPGAGDDGTTDDQT